MGSDFRPISAHRSIRDHINFHMSQNLKNKLNPVFKSQCIAKSTALHQRTASFDRVNWAPEVTEERGAHTQEY